MNSFNIPFIEFILTIQTEKKIVAFSNEAHPPPPRRINKTFIPIIDYFSKAESILPHTYVDVRCETKGELK